MPCSVPVAHARFSLCSGFGHLATANCAEISKANFPKKRTESSKTTRSARPSGSNILWRQAGVRRSPITAVLRAQTSALRRMIAAQTSGRTCFAIELDPLYVDVAIRRWQAFTGEQATLLTDGRTFDAVAAERLNVADVTLTECTPAKPLATDSPHASRP